MSSSNDEVPPANAEEASSFEAATEKAKEEVVKAAAGLVREGDESVSAAGMGGAASEHLGEPVYESAPMDVLSGRGANVNNHPGNKKFRALCFVRKPLFDRSNHAAKRRIATEIVRLMTQPKEPNTPASRFLKKTADKNAPYYLMTEEQAISKAQQVMRDYKRPDRIAMRMNLEATGQLRRRNRSSVSTPLESVVRSMRRTAFVYRVRLDQENLISF
jgi:hypothetical protein